METIKSHFRNKDTVNNIHKKQYYNLSPVGRPIYKHKKQYYNLYLAGPPIYKMVRMPSNPRPRRCSLAIRQPQWTASSSTASRVRT